MNAFHENARRAGAHKVRAGETLAILSKRAKMRVTDTRSVIAGVAPQRLWQGNCNDDIKSETLCSCRGGIGHQHRPRRAGAKRYIG